MAEPPRVVRLDEIEAIAGPGSLTWRPVRHTLGIRAFGCNAYSAAETGRDVVEPHTEGGSDHEELYFVASGHARFTIDGTEHDAPAGTYVFVPDPASHRHAVAEQPGTTVLSFGGPPSFVPSSWEWSFRAGPLMRSDPARARAILEDGLEAHPGDGSLLYNLACLEALSGEREAALAHLRDAVAARPDTAAWARDDADFATLRDDEDFATIVG